MSTATAMRTSNLGLELLLGDTSLNAWNDLQELSKTKRREERGASTTIEAVPSVTEAQTHPYSDQEAEQQFLSLFSSSVGLNFEDGMENPLSRGLTTLVTAYGPLSKDILAKLFEDKSVSPEVLSEALRWLGRMVDQQTYEARLWLIERALASPAPVVRDGAVLGLSSMDDPRAIRYLRLAAEREELPELRSDMLQVLDQLNSGR
jgi:HEAT repeats